MRNSTFYPKPIIKCGGGCKGVCKRMMGREREGIERALPDVAPIKAGLGSEQACLRHCHGNFWARGELGGR